MYINNEKQVFFYDDELDEPMPVRPSFGTSRIATDAGIWCPDCLKNNKYEWLDYLCKEKSTDKVIEFYQSCPVHKKTNSRTFKK